MGGQESAETKRRKEQIKERIETYKSLADHAYMLFEGKYTMHDINTMPFKELMDKIERERKNNEKLKEYRQQQESQNNGGY